MRGISSSASDEWEKGNETQQESRNRQEITRNWSLIIKYSIRQLFTTNKDDKKESEIEISLEIRKLIPPIRLLSSQVNFQSTEMSFAFYVDCVSNNLRTFESLKGLKAKISTINFMQANNE